MDANQEILWNRCQKWTFKLKNKQITVDGNMTLIDNGKQNKLNGSDFLGVVPF